MTFLESIPIIGSVIDLFYIAIINKCDEEGVFIVLTDMITDVWLCLFAYVVERRPL